MTKLKAEVEGKVKAKLNTKFTTKLKSTFNLIFQKEYYKEKTWFCIVLYLRGRGGGYSEWTSWMKVLHCTDLSSTILCKYTARKREKENNSDFLLFKTLNRFSHTSRFQSRWRLSFQIHRTDPLQNLYIASLYNSWGNPVEFFFNLLFFFYNNNLTDFLSENRVFRFLVLPKLEKSVKKEKTRQGYLGKLIK